MGHTARLRHEIMLKRNTYFQSSYRVDESVNEIDVTNGEDTFKNHIGILPLYDLPEDDVVVE